jgi:hypothetical protein
MFKDLGGWGVWGGSVSAEERKTLTYTKTFFFWGGGSQFCADFPLFAGVLGT